MEERISEKDIPDGSSHGEQDHSLKPVTELALLSVNTSVGKWTGYQIISGFGRKAGGRYNSSYIPLGYALVN